MGKIQRNSRAMLCKNEINEEDKGRFGFGGHRNMKKLKVV